MVCNATRNYCNFSWVFIITGVFGLIWRHRMTSFGWKYNQCHTFEERESCGNMMQTSTDDKVKHTKHDCRNISVTYMCQEHMYDSSRQQTSFRRSHKHTSNVMMLPHMITRASLPARQKAAQRTLSSWELSRIRLFECGQAPEHRNSPRFAFGSGKCNNSSDIATGSENKCPLIESEVVTGRWVETCSLRPSGMLVGISSV